MGDSEPMVVVRDMTFKDTEEVHAHIQENQVPEGSKLPSEDEKEPLDPDEETEKLLPTNENKENVDITYDGLLSIIGEYGPKQLRMFLGYCVGIASTSLAFLSPVFTAAYPQKMQCREPGLAHLNLSSELIRNISAGGLDECHMYHRDYSNWTMQTVQDWIKNPFDNHTEVVECMYGYEYDPYPYKDTIVTEWDLVCKDKWKVHSSIVFIGVGKILGCLLYGYLGDKIGRMRPYVFSYISTILLFLACAISPNLIIFCLLNFISGFTAVTVYSVGYTTVSELFGTKVIGNFTILLHLAWVCGLVSLAVLAYFVSSWSKLLLGCASLSLVGLCMLFMVEESPRWLYAKGNPKSFEILKAIAKSNNRTFPENVNIIKDVKPKNIGFIEFFSSKHVFLIGVICSVLWFEASILYFGLSFYLPTFSENPHLNFLFSGLIEIPALAIGQLLITFLSRKTMLSILWLSATVILLVVALSGIPMLKVVLAIIGKGISSIIEPGVVCFTNELYPTEARGKAVSFFYLMYNIAFIIVPQLTLVSETCLVVFVGVCTLFSGILVNFLPETHGKPLCDTLEEMKTNRKIICLK